MKKRVLIAGLLFVVLFLFTGNLFAEELVKKSFFIGEFITGEANWNSSLESDLLGGLSDSPEIISAVVIGRTDHLGPGWINIPLAQKRADLVSGKMIKIKPGATIESRGIIYRPEDGQYVNYKMVEVIITYKKEAQPDNLKQPLEQIYSVLDKIKTTQDSLRDEVQKLDTSLALDKIQENISKLDNGSVLKELRADVSSLSLCVIEGAKISQTALKTRNEEIDKALVAMSQSTGEVNKLLNSLSQKNASKAEETKNLNLLVIANKNLKKVIDSSTILTTQLKETMDSISDSNEKITEKKVFEPIMKVWLSAGIVAEFLVIIILLYIVLRKKKD
ncbi:MAG: hypothetical protein PF572_01560 [Patescibacteria group bacterium]|jgi:hypothetical protein|nr:hypothetical protein [Patescibacteria group bacterium]